MGSIAFPLNYLFIGNTKYFSMLNFHSKLSVSVCKQITLMCTFLLKTYCVRFLFELCHI